jgi:hypothetical protein
MTRPKGGRPPGRIGRGGIGPASGRQATTGGKKTGSPKNGSTGGGGGGNDKGCGKKKTMFQVVVLMLFYALPRYAYDCIRGNG